MGVLAFYSPYPRVGKSTARRCIADLARARNIKVWCESFAMPIRRFAQDLLHKSGIQYRDVPKDAPLPGIPGDRSFRDFMIAMGQSLRSVWPDVWAERLRGEIRSHRDELVVVDDLRMENEYRMLREEGAKIVRIEIPGRPIVVSSTEGLLEWAEFDATVTNSMENLHLFEADLIRTAIELFRKEFQYGR